MSEISKEMGLGECMKMQSEIYLQKTPKRFLFQKVQPDLKTELWARHTLDSVSTVCICPHPNATVSEISTFKSMCDQLTHTTGFFLMQEAFQDHTALRLAMERVRGLQSTVHMWLPTSVFCPPPFWGVKFAVFMLKYYSMLLQNKFQPAVDR